MRRIIILCCFSILTISCSRHEVKIEENIRLEVSGKISDVSGNAISDVSVISSGSETLLPNVAARSTLGIGKTVRNGTFSFVSLYTSNSFFSVNINNPEAEFYKEDYISLNFIDSLNPRNLKIELGEITLAPIVNFSLETTNISARSDSLLVKMKYMKIEKFFNLEVSEEFDLSGNFSNTGEMNFLRSPEEEEINVNLKISGYSEVILRYKFTTNADWEEIFIPVSNTNVSYELEY